MLRRLSRILPVVLVGAVLVAGCTGEGSSANSPGELTVFAATSLTGAFGDLARRFETVHRGIDVRLNFGASTALARQLDEGARGDVVALADESTMESLRHERLVATPSVFARNRLVIVTRPGNPAGIASLADLRRVEIVSLCTPAAPCGAYAAAALHKAGVTLEESRISRGQNAGVALAAVTEGDADAAIVYATDGRAAAGRVATVTIPERHNVVAAYPIATTASPRNAPRARAFVAFVQSDAGQRVLRDHGFLAA